HAVVLLDEIEKAHPDVYNILLQVMDNGMLTDALGKKVDFRNVVLIMTTNAGAADNARAAIGFGRGKVEGEDEKAIQRLFTPEFRNRLDAIITFKALDADTIRQVVTKFILQLEVQLGDRNITLELTDEATDWMAKNGFDELYGARPLGRVIQEHIKKPLADDILFGRLTKGGHVKVALKDGKIVFDISGTETAAKQAADADADEDATAD
uniref:AAA family ATPase n=1 Tax=Brevundimonas sp. TaxID=1871086 RepID=UPI003519148E